VGGHDATILTTATRDLVVPTKARLVGGTQWFLALECNCIVQGYSGTVDMIGVVVGVLLILIHFYCCCCCCFVFRCVKVLFK